MSNYNEFLNMFYADAWLNLANNYPDKKGIEIDFGDLQKYDIDLSEQLEENPDSEIEELQAVLRDHPLFEPMPDACIMLKGIPRDTPLHKIGEGQISRVVSTRGTITQSGDVYVKLVIGAFECQKCGNITMIIQPDDDTFITPHTCENEQCGRQGPFKLLLEQSKKVNEKKIKIQEQYDTLKPGQQPRQIKIVIRGDDLVGMTPPAGAEVSITGIVRVSKKQKSSVFETHIEALHVESIEPDINLFISESEKENLAKLAKDVKILDKLVKSTAPTVKGHYKIKLGMLTIMVSGPNYTVHDRTLRGHAHMAIVGDPGTAKTILSETPRQLMPRSQYAAGLGASGPGLTAAVVKDELSGNGYTVQAGAFILADKGLLVIDELDKMRPEDVQALNTGLESSKVVINKAGINQTFNARCPVIAIANPRDIRFDDYEEIGPQINIPADTLSRFDLIFIIKDTPNPEKDRIIADHIGDMWQQVSNPNNDSPNIEPELDIETMRKYLMYARTFEPAISDEVKTAINLSYLNKRKNNNGTITANARTLEGLYRLTKSMAKLRLSDVCTMDDFKAAVTVQTQALDTFKDPKTGLVDIDSSYGMSQSQRDRAKAIRGIIRELQQSNGNMAGYSEIIAVAKAQGIKEPETLIKRMKASGSIHEVKIGLYRVV